MSSSSLTRNLLPNFSWQAALLVIAVLVSYLGQLRYDFWARYKNMAVLNTSYNIYIEPQPLSPSMARLASFGATEFMADYYWLTLIQYYGGGDPSGKYRKLAELFNLVTELSPKFTQAYDVGLTILPGEGFVDEAIALGEKGEKNLPQRWEIPYNIGLVQHMYKKDYAKAAAKFQQAAQLPGAPANAKYFAAIYYNQANERQTAYLLFKNIYDTTNDEFIKDRTKKYLTHLEIIFYLEDGVKAFRDKFGRYPSTLPELVEKKIISQLPESPLGRRYAVDAASGVVSEVLK